MTATNIFYNFVGFRYSQALFLLVFLLFSSTQVSTCLVLLLCLCKPEIFDKPLSYFDDTGDCSLIGPVAEVH